MRQWRRIGCTLTLGLGLAIAAAPAFGRVAAVSPGDAGREVEAASACPTFSWSASEGASGYELAVFRIDGSDEPALLFTKQVEGSATSWSPSRDACLPPGGSYGWTVRARGTGAPDGSESWAEPLRFKVAGAPGPEELSAALAVLERWRQTRADSGEPPTASEADAPSGLRRGVARRVRGGEAQGFEAPTATGVAAIRGENPDTSGSAFGLLGISHSPSGAGVVARNESAGADLVLDGEANGATDTWLRQDSLDRPSASAESFDFRNSGAGTLTLKVDGVDVVTTATDQDTLGDLSCPAGQIARRNAAGTAWECGLDADALGGLGCAVGQIAKIGPGGTWVCAADDDTLAALACPDGQIAKRSGGAWVCAPDDTGTAGIWSSYAEGSDVRVFNAQGNRIAVGNRAIQPVGSVPSEDGALTVSHKAALPLTTQYNLTMDGKGLQARSQASLFDPQVDAPLLLNRYGGGVSIGKTTAPTRAALEAQGSVSNTMALFQRAANGQGLALVGDWPGLYANAYWNNGVQTMSSSGYSELINFDQSDGAISFMTSTDPNTTADVPAVTLGERLRLNRAGGLLSSLTQNQFNLAPLAVLSARYQILSDGGGGLQVTPLQELVRSAFPVSLQVNTSSGSTSWVSLEVTISAPGTSELVPVLGWSDVGNLVIQPSVWHGTGGTFKIFMYDGSFSGALVGRTWYVQVLVYGLN